MIITGKTKPPRKGFLLMEALLAFSIFGIAVTSIVIALHHTSKVSYEINREAWVQAQLKNILTEVITIRTPEDEFPRDEIRDLPNAKARILITEITEPTYSEDTTAEILKNMYQVTVTLYWDEDGTEQSQSATITHYYPLHQIR
jgi:hypothetical protein